MYEACCNVWICIFVSKYFAVVGVNTVNLALLFRTCVILNGVEYFRINVIWFTNLWRGRQDWGCFDVLLCDWRASWRAYEPWQLGRGWFPSVFRWEINRCRFRGFVVPGQKYICKPYLTRSLTRKCRLSSVRIYVLDATHMDCDRCRSALAETAKLVSRRWCHCVVVDLIVIFKSRDKHSWLQSVFSFAYTLHLLDLHCKLEIVLMA